MSAAEMLALRKEQLEAELAKTEKTVRRRKRVFSLKSTKRGKSSISLRFLPPPKLFSQIYDLETKYLAAEYSHAGTVLKVREWMIAEKIDWKSKKKESNFLSFSFRFPLFFSTSTPSALSTSLSAGPGRLPLLQGRPQEARGPRLQGRRQAIFSFVDRLPGDGGGRGGRGRRARREQRRRRRQQQEPLREGVRHERQLFREQREARVRGVK